MTHNQQLVLMTLQEHQDAGGHPIDTHQIAKEANNRHNRWFTYDALHSMLTRMQNQAWVRRDTSRPTRWDITDEGRKALTESQAE